MSHPAYMFRFRLCILLTVLLVASACSGPEAQERGATASADPPAELPTTIVVVRHAERADDDPEDPTLTPAGEERARALVEVVEAAGVSVVYSTQFRRTRATVAPLAEELDLPVQILEASFDSVEAHVEALADELLSQHAGESIVVAGHSNTVPLIVEALSGYPMEELTEEEYDHVYVVVVSPEGSARVFHARYGAPSNS